MELDNKQDVENQKNEDNINEEEDDNNYEKLPFDYTKYDLNYKIIIIGDSGVGKTCLMNKATKGEFLDKVEPTIGFDYNPFILRYKEKILKLEIWDTCGQEAYRSLIDGFFNNSSLAIIVYGINDAKSFDSIDGWIRQCKIKCSPETKFILIGNKADLNKEEYVNIKFNYFY